MVCVDAMSHCPGCLGFHNTYQQVGTSGSVSSAPCPGCPACAEKDAALAEALAECRKRKGWEQDIAHWRERAEAAEKALQVADEMADAITFLVPKRLWEGNLELLVQRYREARATTAQ